MEDELGRYPGVISTEVGYTGGATSHPTYEQVCSGRTGHTESVKVVFDVNKTSYKALVTRFLDKHDPWFSMPFAQSAQYKTAIFYVNPEQQKEAAEAIKEFEKSKNRRAGTQLQPSAAFWRAEEYHQHYYQKNHLGACRIN